MLEGLRPIAWVRSAMEVPSKPDLVARRTSDNLYLLQIGIGGWISENSQHRDNLTFVMKRVGYDVQQDKSRTPEFTAPIDWTLCKRCVKLLFIEIVQISSCCLANTTLGG